MAIDQDSWCENYQSDAASVTVSYDNAGVEGITVTSNKSLVGKNGATIKGKGIRIANAQNVIVQNVAFTDINPKYVWGGDAVTLDTTDMVWIDHVTVSSTLLFSIQSDLQIRGLEFVAKPAIYPLRPQRLAGSTSSWEQHPLDV